MSTDTTETQLFDLNLTINYTLEVGRDDAIEIERMINEGEIEHSSIEDYLTEMLIDEVETQLDNNVWIPEVDGAFHAWITSVDSDTVAEKIN